MEIVKFKEKLLAFDFSKEMVNATDLLKLNPNKRMADYLKLKQTKELIEALESDVDNSRVTVIEVVRGNYSDGRSQGTWMHRLLAYDFAAWLSIDIRLFIYNTFDQFIQKEMSKLNDKLDTQQRQLDYFWDKEDIKDLYRRNK